MSSILLSSKNQFCKKTRPLDKDDEEIRFLKQQRFEAAKKIFNEMSHEHLVQYQESKIVERVRSKYVPKTHEELQKRIAKIDQLKEHLNVQQNGFGYAQNQAVEYRTEQDQYFKNMQVMKEEQIQKSKERYVRAVKSERKMQQQNKLRLQKSETRKNLKNARDSALARENSKLINYQQEKERKHKQRVEYLKKEKEHEYIHVPPQNFYPAMISISSYGQLPENNDAILYEKEMKDQIEDNAIIDAKRKRSIKKRTKEAIYRFHCEKNMKELDLDAKRIYKYEQNKVLEKLKHPPPLEEQGFHPTYLVNDRLALREEQINLVFTASEPPQPRSNAPPHPYESIPSSPTGSPDSSCFSDNS